MAGLAPAIFISAALSIVIPGRRRRARNP